MAKYDWVKLKAKYISGTYDNLKTFAEKENINYNVLRRKASKWQEEKSQNSHKIVTKIATKTIEKIANKESTINADRNAKFLQLSDLASSAIEEYLTEKHYKQHVVKYKYYDAEGKPDKEELTAVELPVADTKALANMIASLDRVQTGQRKAEGLDKAIELEKLKIEQRKLELLIAKAGDSDDSVSKSNDNIVMLAGLLNDPVETRTVDEFAEDE